MREAQKGFKTMKTAVATTTENAATVAEQGAPVAPETASSKKGATQKKDAPKGQKRPRAVKPRRPRRRRTPRPLFRISEIRIVGLPVFHLDRLGGRLFKRALSLVLSNRSPSPSFVVRRKAVRNCH
jgi:hypothetical protein